MYVCTYVCVMYVCMYVRTYVCMYAFLIQRHFISNVLFQFRVTYRIANILYYVHMYFFVSTSHKWMENNRKFRYETVAIEACVHYPIKSK